MRTKISVFLGIVFIFSGMGFAQTAPDTLWTKIFGGSEHDKGFLVQQTSDGDNVLLEKIISKSISKGKVRHPSESKIFNKRKSRTIVNKLIQDTGFLRGEELQQHWDDANWVNDWKSTYTYDGNNNLIEMLHQVWDGFNWVNDWKQLYEYDVNNNLTELLGQSWDGSNWVNIRKFSRMFDDNNNNTQSLYQLWWSGFNWVNSWKELYAYDVNNNRTEFIKQSWDGFNWVNNERVRSTYYPMTTIKYDVNTFDAYYLSYNYPNPFNPSTKIKYSLQKSETVKIEVYNTLGQKIETLLNKQMPAGYHEIEFNAQNLPSGVYMYRIKAGEFHDVKKMILLR